jgi:hypothetical protein
MRIRIRNPAIFLLKNQGFFFTATLCNSEIKNTVAKVVSYLDCRNHTMDSDVFFSTKVIRVACEGCENLREDLQQYEVLKLIINMNTSVADPDPGPGAFLTPGS